MPVAAMSRAVVTVSQAPERALRMPDTFQSEATTRSARLVNCGVSNPTVTLAM